jgi:hypothetical protein
MSTYRKRGAYLTRPRFKNTPEDVSDKGSSMARRSVSAQKREDAVTDKPLTRAEFDAIRKDEEAKERANILALREMHAAHEIEVRKYEQHLRHAREQNI